jgi:hypothetical protein
MLKAISLYQIAGGITGILFVVWIFISNRIFGPLIFVGLFSICFYAYSIVCGIKLLKLTKDAFNYTIVNLV